MAIKIQELKIILRVNTFPLCVYTAFLPAGGEASVEGSGAGHQRAARTIDTKELLLSQ